MVGEWHGCGRKGSRLLDGIKVRVLGVEVVGLEMWFVGQVWIWSGRKDLRNDKWVARLGRLLYGAILCWSLRW